MSVRDIPKDKIVAVAGYLDEFPPLAPGQKEEDVEQYYSLLCAELRSLPPPLGAKFKYSRSQMTEFGMATLSDDSPGLLLLRDLQKRGLPFNAFYGCLDRIGCQKAINEFISATRPEVIQQPQSQTLFEGDALQLECRARCKPGSPAYFWFRRRDPTAEWEPIVDSFTERLVLEDVNRDHTGVYVCRATNPQINDPLKANVFSEEASVKVEIREIKQKTPIRQETVPADSQTDPPVFPPVIHMQPLPLTVEYGQSATLLCQAPGSNLTYDWFKNNKYINTQSSSGSVKIKHARLEDDGLYYCKVTNSEGGVAKSDTVRLTVVPVIIIDKQPPKTLHGYKSGRIRLECSAHCSRESIGEIEYQWFKNKTAISGETSGVYEGTLRCRSSAPTNISYHCQVSVRGRTDLLPMKSTITSVTVNCIRITVQPRDVSGVTGGSAALCCKAIIIPPVPNNGKKIDYIWLKSDGKGEKKELLSQALQPQTSEGRLVFDRLSMNHDGYYVCQACFNKEFIESDEVKLTVTMAGAQPPARISIVRQPVSWVVEAGGTFKMRCRAHVTPEQPLLYQWLKNNARIPNETSSELIRNKVKDYAVYQCEVKTADGSVSCLSESAVTKPAHTGEQDSVSSIGSEAERKLLTLSGERYAREKVALLIGNQRYECSDLNRLKHTEEEVRKVAEKLSELNFKVFTFVNLRLSEMKEVMTWFFGLLSAGVYGLFYYSGHGFSVSKMSYLMPVDLLSGDPDATECIGSDWITSTMQKTLCRAVIVLDCCRVIRNNSGDVRQAETPFASFNAANLLEIHSTSHGSVAYEGSAFSPSFIAALDENNDINTLNVQLLDTMRKKGDLATPWHNGSMNDKISLRDCIMRDKIEKEQEAERICDVTEAVQSVPVPVVLEGVALGGLVSLLSLRLVCSAPFTNVLTVQVKVDIKRPNISPSVILDSECLKSQELEAQVLKDENDDISYNITLLNMQRLKEPLVLQMMVTVSVPESGDMRERIEHTFSQSPLRSLLKTTNTNR